MDPLIRNLPSTTFCGERLSRHQIAEIQETVKFFPELSRTELVRTVCVQMDWHTPGGATRPWSAFYVTEGSKSDFLAFWHSIPPQIRLRTVC